MPHLKQSFILIVLCVAVLSACTAKQKNSSLPSDFVFILDAHGQQDLTGDLNVNIKINAEGKGHFEYYDSEGVIRYDLNKMVTYDTNQIVKRGKFQLTNEELGQLWDMLNESHFFELEENYQMELGYSYAFIMVEMNGQRHMVDNIGMEVPEVRAIVERLNGLLPKEVQLEYRKGFTP